MSGAIDPIKPAWKNAKGDYEFIHEMANTRIRNILAYLYKRRPMAGDRLWIDLFQKELEKRGVL